MKTRVDIAVACSSAQSFEWWAPTFVNLLLEEQRGIEIGQVIATGSALPDSNKNEALQQKLPQFDRELWESKRRADLTDANRNKAAFGFLTGSPEGYKSDWVWWLDDDTVPADGALSTLLETGKNFVAGIYHLGRPPYNPIAYVRHPDDKWGYRALYGYTPGSLFQVASVGMGCTLIHRSVYEKIMDEFTVFVRPNGTLLPIHKSKIKVADISSYPANEEEEVINGVLVQKLELPSPDDNRCWPFYAMEYIRTEDHYFCELAAQVGILPWIDSSVQCKHIKSKEITEKDYREVLNEREGLSIRGI